MRQSCSDCHSSNAVYAHPRPPIRGTVYFIRSSAQRLRQPAEAFSSRSMRARKGSVTSERRPGPGEIGRDLFPDPAGGSRWTKPGSRIPIRPQTPRIRNWPREKGTLAGYLDSGLTGPGCWDRPPSPRISRPCKIRQGHTRGYCRPTLPGCCSPWWSCTCSGPSRPTAR